MEAITEASWNEALGSYFSRPEFQQLKAYIDSEYAQHTIYPPKEDIFATFSATSLENVKVVIIGQDPYHNEGQAHGLAFSVPKGVTPPPSLKNIYKELHSDLGIKKDMTNGDLSSWARQGVLLLNAVLTVQAHKAASHANRGWEAFTDYVIQYISQNTKNYVFILWGSYAQKKGKDIDRTQHLVLESPHPSPLSAYRGFFGSNVFSQTNDYLQQHGKDPIQW
jgi:uracil-DNA glycosylase